MSKWTLKSPKNWHNAPVVLCWHSKNFESNKRQRISFRPQRWHVPYRNHHTCCKKLWFVRRLYPKPDPNQTKNLPRHVRCHSMIACQVSWISDEFWIYWNLKTWYLNVCGRVTVEGCVKFIPIYMGPKHATKDTYLIFQPVCMHWRMCMYFKFELCT